MNEICKDLERPLRMQRDRDKWKIKRILKINITTTKANQNNAATGAPMEWNVAREREREDQTN